MVNLPAARRHHRSHIGYAFGLLVLLGAATALVVVARHPAFSATAELTAPVPAPEITVAGEGTSPPDDLDGPDEPGWAYPTGADPQQTDAPAGAGAAGAGAGGETLADGRAGGGVTTSADVSRSLFYSGVLGLAISLAGLGLVGTRRRQW